MSSASKSGFRWNAANQALAPAELADKKQDGMVQVSSFIAHSRAASNTVGVNVSRPPLHALRSLGHGNIPRGLIGQ